MFLQNFKCNVCTCEQYLMVLHSPHTANEMIKDLVCGPFDCEPIKVNFVVFLYAMDTLQSVAVLA